MTKLLRFVLLTLAVTVARGELSKRVLPTNKNCDPEKEVCRKGDWIAPAIADCKYVRSWFKFFCAAQNDHWASWTVNTAKGDRCIPVSGTQFTCGEAGTNTRCVCSDPNIFYNFGFNECRCQYWPDEDPGASLPALCTGYYTGGESGVHHWACCDNCNDSTADSCNGTTWQGGSIASYCGSCGENTGGGRVKYYFNCGGCSDQQECEEYCSSKYLHLLGLPGLCWSWLDCFKGCCLERTKQPSRSKREIETMEFCGDGTCSEGESSATCPPDCCNTLIEDCECCLDDITDTRPQESAASTIVGTALTLVILVALAGIF